MNERGCGIREMERYDKSQARDVFLYLRLLLIIVLEKFVNVASPRLIDLLYVYYRGILSRSA